MKSSTGGAHVAEAVRAVSVVADDTTGAGDCAVQFVRAGWEGSLLLTEGARPSLSGDFPRVLFRSTDVRAADRETSLRETGRAVREAGDRVYIKVDSTGRGSFGAQVHGALNAWRETVPSAAAVVCPAYPEEGRTVIDGRLRVDGDLASRGAAGRDPVTPLATDDLTFLTGGRRAGTEEIESLEPGAVVVVDACTRADLDEIAAAISRAGPHVVPVGSAGLAGSLSRAWRTAPRAKNVGVELPARTDLVFVSSLHPVSRGQVEHAVAHGVAESRVLPEGRLLEVAEAVRPFEDTAASSRGVGWILATPSGGSGTGLDARDIARHVGEAVARVVVDHTPRVLGLVGGDGAQAVLAGLGASAARVLGAIDEGMPVLVLDDGRAPGLVVWTKSGGFGGEGLLTALLTDLSPRKETTV